MVRYIERRITHKVIENPTSLHEVTSPTDVVHNLYLLRAMVGIGLFVGTLLKSGVWLGTACTPWMWKIAGNITKFVNLHLVPNLAVQSPVKTQVAHDDREYPAPTTANSYDTFSCVHSSRRNGGMHTCPKDGFFMRVGRAGDQT